MCAGECTETRSPGGWCAGDSVGWVSDVGANQQQPPVPAEPGDRIAPSGQGDRIAPSGQEGRAISMVLGSALSLQFGAAFGVLLIDRVGAAGAVAIRLVLAAVVLVAVIRPRLWRHSPRDLALGAVFGLTLGLMNLTFYEAAARLPLGAAVTLEFLGPLGVAIALSRRFRDLIWVLLAGAGVYLLSEGGLNRLSGIGVLFALAAGLCWACYILLGSRASRRFPGAEALAIALITSSVLVAPFGIVSAGETLLDWRILALGLGVALMSSVLPYSLELSSLRRIPPRIFGVLMSLEPAVAALAGFLVLRQTLSWWQVLAIALVVIASAGATFSARKR